MIQKKKCKCKNIYIYMILHDFIKQCKYIKNVIFYLKGDFHNVFDDDKPTKIAHCTFFFKSWRVLMPTLQGIPLSRYRVGIVSSTLKK